MSLPYLIAIVSTFCFGIAAIVFSIREEKAKAMLADRVKEQQRRLYEISILKQMHDRIGYSLDLEKVLNVITHSLNHLFVYSTVSSLIIKDGRLIFNTQISKPVSHVYVEQIKMSMLNALAELNHTTLPRTIDENISGVALDHENQASPASLFHIPFIVKNRVVGLITLSSTKPNVYKEKEMGMIYQITGVASYALSQLEDILTTEKGKFMAMIGALGDGLIMVDSYNQINIINNQAKKILNIQKEDPTIYDVLSSLPNTFDFGGKIQQVLMQNQQMVEIKEALIGKRIYNVIITPVHDNTSLSKEKVMGASIFFHDITDDLSVAQMKEDFTNIIVHELRSPLTAIKASSDLLTTSTKLGEQERSRLLDLISIQSKKLLDEISLILDAAKLEAGLFTVQKQHGDLKKIIDENINCYSPEAQGKLIDLKAEVDPNLPAFSFDPHHIDQVLNNLLANSLKFTPAGGKIRIKAESRGNNIEVSVTDTGSGIPKDKQHLLFSKFSQLQNPSAQIGTGLGLYIVKGVIEAHGGSVSVTSEEGKGTAVTFMLPIDTLSQQKIMDTSHDTQVNNMPQEVLN